MKQRKLARALMQIVFTEDDLQKCTIRDSKRGKRPDLDQDGVNNILCKLSILDTLSFRSESIKYEFNFLSSIYSTIC